MKKGNSLWLVIAAVVIVALAAALFKSVKDGKEKQENLEAMEEVMSYEKNKLEDEYTNVAEEMQDFHLRVNNDSILNLLDKEQQRVQMLLQELKNTKATDAKRISELRKELTSVRGALQYYVAQVDSLNKVNAVLITENREVKELYESASATVQELANQNSELSEKVSIASQMEARNITVSTLSESGKPIRRLKKVTMVKVDYVVAKNITTQSGEKVAYLRLMSPDGTILGSGNHTFEFEGRNIQYTSKKSFEFTGQERAEVIYWNVNQTLTEGTYRADLFIDGHLVGSKNFTLE